MAEAQPVVQALDCQHCYRKISQTPAGKWRDGQGNLECVPKIEHQPMPII